MKSEPVHQDRTLWRDPSPITALMKMYLVTGRVVDVNVVRCFQSSREFRTNHEGRAKVKVWFLLKINNGFKVNKICFSMCTICGFASLRNSRFLTFSKRSRTGGKLRESAKISSTGRGEATEGNACNQSQTFYRTPPNMPRSHSRPQRPRSFWSAPRIATSGLVQRHSVFEWLLNTID